MITVRRATPADQKAIYAFIQQAYVGRWQYKIPERWEWIYLDNPYLEADELPLWIAVDEDGTVVGQTGALIEPLATEAGDLRVGWSIDTFLLPEYRGQGLGRKLQQANDEANPVFMSLSMSAANRHIKASLGSTPLEPVSTYVRTVRHDPERALGTFFDRRGLAAGPWRELYTGLLQTLRVDHFLARILTLRSARRASQEIKRTDPAIQVEAVSEINSEFNILWEQVSPHYRALIRRDQEYLKRKYDDQPHTDYYRLIARRGGAICGYLILRTGRSPEPFRGILTDLFTAPEDRATIFALLTTGVAYLQGLGVESILAGTNLPLYQEALEILDFRATKPVTPMIHCRASAPICETLLSPGAWLLGKGDHDWDQFPLG